MDTDYEAKLAELLHIVRETQDMRARSQLYKFYTNCRYAYVQLDKEKVECRRLQKVTHKYTELEAKLQESIITFEHWIVMAALSY